MAPTLGKRGRTASYNVLGGSPRLIAKNQRNASLFVAAALVVGLIIAVRLPRHTLSASEPVPGKASCCFLPRRRRPLLLCPPLHPLLAEDSCCAPPPCTDPLQCNWDGSDLQGNAVGLAPMPALSAVPSTEPAAAASEVCFMHTTSRDLHNQSLPGGQSPKFQRPGTPGTPGTAGVV